MTWPKARCPSVAATNCVSSLYEIPVSNNHCHTKSGVCYIIAVYSLPVSTVRASVCTYLLHSTHTVPSSVKQKIYGFVYLHCVWHIISPADCKAQMPKIVANKQWVVYR